MIKYKHLLNNLLNLMKKCQICGRKIGQAYGTNIGLMYKLEKSCYKCSTIIQYVFEGDRLSETTFIADGLKIEINHNTKTSSLFKREINYIGALKKHVEIKWVSLAKMDEEFDFDVENLKNIKAKMETMMLFS